MPDLREQLQELFGLDDFRPAQREVIEDVLAGRDVLCVMPTGRAKACVISFRRPFGRRVDDRRLAADFADGRSGSAASRRGDFRGDAEQLADAGDAAAGDGGTESGFRGPAVRAPGAIVRGEFQHAARAAASPSCWRWTRRTASANGVTISGRNMRGWARRAEARAIRPHRADRDGHRRRARRHHRAAWICASRRSCVTGFDRPKLLYESRAISKVAEKDATADRLAAAGAGQRDRLLRDAKSGGRGRRAAGGESDGGRSFRITREWMRRRGTANQERFMQTPARDRAWRPTRSAWGSTSRTFAWWCITTCPGRWRRITRRPGAPGATGSRRAACILFSYQDRYTQEFFIDKLGEEIRTPTRTLIAAIARNTRRRKLELMIRYASTHRCRRQMILDYFGDEAEVERLPLRCLPPDGRAEPMRRPVETAVADEVVTLVRQILSAIARCSGKFGVGVVAEVLAGSRKREDAEMGLGSLSDIRLAACASDQADHRDAASRDGSGVGAAARSGRREIPPGGRADRAGVAVMKGRAAAAGGAGRSASRPA